MNFPRIIILGIFEKKNHAKTWTRWPFFLSFNSFLPSRHPEVKMTKIDSLY